MRAEWTPAVFRAVQAARARAVASGDQEVLPLNLLHGLLAEEEGRAAVLAVAAGLAWADYRQELSPVADLPETADLPLHESSRDLLAAASELALEFAGDRTVAGESLLLALVRTDDVRPHLERFGFRADALEAHLAATRVPRPALDEPLHLADATEQIDLARVVDACANRAREGLRVAEDFCRFVLEDPLLCRELKSLRHDLTAALAPFAETALLAGRDTQHDVGTTITTPREQQRYSLQEVAQANLKRLQEALRSLEEFGKLHAAGLGAALEKLRYRTYTLERAIVLGTTARQRLAHARLYVLLGAGQCRGPLEWTVRQAVAGGADVIQLREKNLDDRTLLERARQVRRWTHELGALFIVNDRPDVARLVEADGVHLGQDDLPVKDARRIVGAEALVGVSTHNLDQLRQAVFDGASYLGIGPTFPSGTKDFAELAGLQFVRDAVAETTLPAFVLGGVNLNNIGAALAAGAHRVAVSQAIAQADDPQSLAAQLVYALSATPNPSNK